MFDYPTKLRKIARIALAFIAIGGAGAIGWLIGRSSDPGQSAASTVTSQTGTTLPAAPITLPPTPTTTIAPVTTTAPTTVAPTTTTTTEPPQPEYPLPPGVWDLVFADEFSGTELDESKWSTCHWWNDGGCTIASNQEEEWYLPDNVSVSDGTLALSAIREDFVVADGREFGFSSGMVSTGPPAYRAEPRFAFTFGYVEVRARIPSGRGLWPAFWMLPPTFESKPEIDILEVTGDAPTELRIRLHYRDSSGSDFNRGGNISGPDLSADWHVFGLWWADDAVSWYLDGEELWRYDGDGISTEPMYLVANLAVGGVWPGPPDSETVFPALFEIDLVRVWQSK